MVIRFIYDFSIYLGRPSVFMFCEICLHVDSCTISTSSVELVLFSDVFFNYSR